MFDLALIEPFIYLTGVSGIDLSFLCHIHITS